MNFNAGDFLLDNALQSGSPVEVGDQIKTLIENDQHYTTWEIANITQNIQINKVIGEMKNVFYFTEKTKQTFWLT